VAPATIDVRYARDSKSEKGSIVGFLVAGTAGAVIGGLVQRGFESAEDDHRAEEARRSIASYAPHEALAQHFVNELRKLRPDIAVSIEDQFSTNVDAIIHLEIAEFILRASGPDLLKPYGLVKAKMTPRHADTVIWQRTIAHLGDERYTFEQYRSDDGRLLVAAIDKILRKASRRLAVDFQFPQ
jgi:hypothetical protein